MDKNFLIYMQKKIRKKNLIYCVPLRLLEKLIFFISTDIHWKYVPYLR